MTKNSNSRGDAITMGALPRLIFMSRWLQLPLYLGLVAAQGVDVWHFLVELWHLIRTFISAANCSDKVLIAVTDRLMAPTERPHRPPA